LASPTDLVKVRMQANPRRYSGVTGAFRQILAEGGWRGLFRGLGPTVQRAAVLTASQVPSYDHIKSSLRGGGGVGGWLDEGPVLHAVASMGAGLVAAAATSPVDVVKTRVMNAAPGVYNGSLHCARQLLLHEGASSFYKGFLPNWLRIGPHTIITFLVYERLRSLAGLNPV
jgi:hypothetical protein